MASIIKCLVLEFLIRNNKGRRQKNFQDRAIKIHVSPSNISKPRQSCLIITGVLGAALAYKAQSPPLTRTASMVLYKSEIFSGESPISKKMPT